MARCRYCGKTFWLRLSSRSGEFCGEEHRRQYDELVLARLQADEPERDVPGEPLGPLAESEPVAGGSPAEVEVEDQGVPAGAGFQQTGPITAWVQKSQPRQAIGFRQEAMAWRLPEVRRHARPVAAEVTALRASAAPGVLEPRPAVAWKLPWVCLAARRNAVPFASGPQLAKVRDLPCTREFDAGGNSPVFARGQWIWRGVLPIHAGPVIGPLVWETPRPARFIRLRVASQAPAAARHPAVWSHTAREIPERRLARPAAFLPAAPLLVSARPQDQPAKPLRFDQLPTWSHTTLAIPARRFTISAGLLPARPHSGLARSADRVEQTSRLEIRLGIAPIVLPRLETHPGGLPVVRKEDSDSLAEPEPGAALSSRFAWVRSRWSAAPRFVRAAVLILPLLAASVSLAPRIPRALRSLHWQNPALARQIESRLQQRAVIEVIEDFRSGLSGWEGGPEWSEGWSYDPAGFVHPGKLALLTASRALADYRLEFRGLVERKGIGWVFRATDLRNYYAIQIVISRPGPLPRAVLVRKTVTDGEAVERVELPLPISIRIGKFYDIQTSAYQDRFVTSIDGRVVDTFFGSDHRAGGVGLFSEAGEDARVMALRVVDRDDFLGRLCAYFLRHSADSASEATPSASRSDPGGIEPK